MGTLQTSLSEAASGTLSGAAETTRNGVAAGTRLALDGLKSVVGSPLTTEAAKGAVRLGVTSASILAMIGIFGAGIMTLIGKPPDWMKNTILPS